MNFEALNVSTRRTFALFKVMGERFNRAPTPQELMTFLGVMSTSVTWFHMKKLEKGGALKRDEAKKMRVVVDDIYPMLREKEIGEAELFLKQVEHGRVKTLQKRGSIVSREKVLDPNATPEKIQRRADVRRAIKDTATSVAEENKLLHRERKCQFPLWSDKEKNPNKKKFCGKPTYKVRDKWKPYCKTHWRLCSSNWREIESGRRTGRKGRPFQSNLRGGYPE